MNWQTIGFNKTKKFFENNLVNGQLSHAYIFSGQDEIGKKTLALDLANSVTNSTYDILILGPENSESGRSISINEIKKLKSFMSLSPYGSDHKVAIIDDAHLMTAEAQNATLKTLEEPSHSSLLILVTSAPTSLLETIYSRCQEIRFLPHPKKEIGVVLESSGLNKSQKEFLSEFANGRIGLVKKVDNKKGFEEIKESVEELMRLMKMGLNERLISAQKLSDDKKTPDLERKVLYWLLYVHMRLSEPKAVKILKNLLHLQNIIAQPQFNKRLALENFVITL